MVRAQTVPNRFTNKADKIRLDTEEKVKNVGCTKGALITSQLRHNFQASQAVHGADDITTPNF